MARMGRLSILVGIAMVLSLFAAPAWACVSIVDVDGTVKVICGGDGGSGGGGSGGGGGGGAGDPGSGERVCQFNGRTVSCSGAGGVWLDAANAWCSIANPQPPKEDPIWSGRTTGAIWSCTRPGFGGIPDPSLSNLMWLSQTDSTPLPPPDPEELAWRAIAQLQLRPIDIGVAPEALSSNPESLGAVGLPIWLWSETTGPQVTGPASASASERGYTVTINAHMSRIEWNLGDGGPIVECGIGQRFDPATMGVETPVACGRQSGYQKQGVYTVTATSYWEVNWAGIGQTGTIYLDHSASEAVRIGEIQTVVVDN